MPFTFAHPAAVLPLRAAGVPLTAFVVGSMVPDVPLFVARQGYSETHSLSGVVTIDVVVGMAALTLWWVVLRSALVDAAPSVVRERLAPFHRPRGWELVLALPALAAGALTHVVWDSFTHPRRWGPRHVAWLREEHGGVLGTQWAQHLSGVVGLVVLALAAVAFLRAQSVLPDRSPRVLPVWAGLVVVVVPLARGLVEAAETSERGLHHMVFEGVVTTTASGGFGVLVLALVWHVTRLAAASRRRPVGR